jgi:hypothetical protein
MMEAEFELLITRMKSPEMKRILEKDLEIYKVLQEDRKPPKPGFR